MNEKTSGPVSARTEDKADKSNAFATISPPPAESKPFNAVEKKLSLALDALLDAIQSYREGKE